MQPNKKSHILHLDTIDSTNQWCKDNCSFKEEDELFIVIAKHQTQGRGQENRIWHSPPNQNIYMSFCFLKTNEMSLMNLSQLFSLCCTQYLETFSLKPQIKWPNDIMVDSHKIGGILTEVSKNKCIVGIGLNINMGLSDLAKIDQKATSLSNEMGYPIELDKATSELYQICLENFALFKKEGFHPFYESYKRHLLFLGERITITAREKTFYGKLLSLEEDGSIILELSNGEKQKILSGRIGSCLNCNVAKSACTCI